MSFASANNYQVTWGVGFGTVLAMICSRQRQRSILWAIPHGILSWLYVIWFALTRRTDETS